VRTEPPEKPCDPEVVAGMRQMGFPAGYKLGNDKELWLTNGRPSSVDEVPAPPEGPITMTVYQEVLGGNSKFRIPKGTRLHGQVFHGKDRLYGWITDMETPDGKHYPVCANLVTNSLRDELGLMYRPSSTPEKPMVKPFANLATSTYLGRLGK
jgi:hypothetical protein